MSKVFRYGVRILAGFILIWIILGMGVWIYFRTHKVELTAKVNSFLNTRFRGNIHIRDIGINLWKNFPYPALQVNGVTIDDSVYGRTGQHTLYMEKIRIVPGFKGLFRGNPSIQKVVLEGGGLYLYRDSLGYYNGYVWSGRKNSAGPADKAADKSGAPSLPWKIQLDNVSISIADSTSHKSFVFQVHHLSMDHEDAVHEDADHPSSSTTPSGSGTNHWRTSMEVTVTSLAFNTRNGSYLKDREVRVRGMLDFSIEKKLFSFRRLALDVDGQNLLVDGAFHFDKSDEFNLHIDAPSLVFQTGRSWLAYKTSRKLDSLHFEHPLAVDARIQGRLSRGGDPKIKVAWVVRKNTVSGYIGAIYDCSFTGAFINTVDPMLPAGDANSVIYADSLEGKYENSIAFHTHRLEIHRLDTAVMIFDLGVHNDVGPWQDLLQSEDLSFDNGKVDMDLSCRLPLTENSGISSTFGGTIRIKDAKITYLPRHVQITDGQVQLAFDHQDLVIRQISGKIGKSPIKITGSAQNLLALANTDAGKMVLDWKLYSPSLDLGTLLPFLGKGSSSRSSTKSGTTAAAGTSRDRSSKPAMFIDRYIKRCRVNTQLHLDRLSYNNFSATQVDAVLLLNNGSFSLPHATLQMAKGTVSLSGTLNNDGGEENKVKLNAVLTHLDLSALFYAFDDFGQQSLKSHNLAGILNARTNLSMLLTDKGKKVPGSLEGTLDFTIDQGALINFSPLMKLSNFALKNRDLTHVYFSQLHDVFGFSKDTVDLNKMEIQSSVLEMFVEGMYKLDGAYTNADIQVPLINLKKKKGVPKKNVGVDTNHGLSIYVHAYNTGQEPLHYKFGLFKKKVRS